MDRSCCYDDQCGRPDRICCDGEYIVEKVVGRFRQPCCYRGPLIVEPGEEICPPLCLKHIEVTNIAPVCTAGCSSHGMQRLCLTLMLFMIDGRGCRYQSSTQIETEVCDLKNGPNVGLENIRRGARVCVRYAQYCPPTGFETELQIEIETLITRLEAVGRKGMCVQNCPQLPLYPPPPRPKGECSCRWMG